jgi:hypothetical protein
VKKWRYFRPFVNRHSLLPHECRREQPATPTAQWVGAVRVALLQKVNVPFGAVIPAWSLAGIGRLRSERLTSCSRPVRSSAPENVVAGARLWRCLLRLPRRRMW